MNNIDLSPEELALVQAFVAKPSDGKPSAATWLVEIALPLGLVGFAQSFGHPELLLFAFAAAFGL